MNPDNNRPGSEPLDDLNNRANDEQWLSEQERRDRRIEQLRQEQERLNRSGEALNPSEQQRPNRPPGQFNQPQPPLNRAPENPWVEQERLTQRIEELQLEEDRRIRRIEQLRHEEDRHTRRIEELRHEEDRRNRRIEQIQLEDEERRVAGLQRRATVAKAIQVIYYLTAALGVLLFLRVLLRLLGANPDNQFAGFIYELSYPFVAPFDNLFGTPAFGRSAFEINVLIAMAVYALLTWLVVRLVRLIWNSDTV